MEVTRTRGSPYGSDGGQGTGGSQSSQGPLFSTK